MMLEMDILLQQWVLIYATDARRHLLTDWSFVRLLKIELNKRWKTRANIEKLYSIYVICFKSPIFKVFYLINRV